VTPPGQKKILLGSGSRIKRANAWHFLTSIMTGATIAQIPFFRKKKPHLKAPWRDRQIKV
jgi:hypothetical protein